MKVYFLFGFLSMHTVNVCIYHPELGIALMGTHDCALQLLKLNKHRKAVMPYVDVVVVHFVLWVFVVVTGNNLLF